MKFLKRSSRSSTWPNLPPSNTWAQEISASGDGALAASVTADHLVKAWDLSARTLTASFSGRWSLGGRRLAMSPSGQSLVTGAYDRLGITHYAADGRELWRRRDLTRVQQLAIDQIHNEVVAVFQDRACHVLDLTTGMTRANPRGIYQVKIAGDGSCRLLGRSRDVVVVRRDDSAVLFSAAPENWAVLDCAFTPIGIALTFSGGDTRLVNASGVQWRYRPPSEHHILRLGWCEERGEVLGCERHYERGGEEYLVRLNLDGRLVKRIRIPPGSDGAFVMSGTAILGRTGLMIDSASGMIVDQLLLPSTPHLN